MTIEIRDKSFAIAPDELLPPVTPDSEPYWTALSRGTLLLQHCLECRRMRYPIAPVCPHCGGMQSEWSAASGRGKVLSWVRYHRQYLPEFADLIPYVVLAVALEEGPSMFARLVDASADPGIGDAVGLVVERWPGGRHMPVFKLMGEAP